MIELAPPALRSRLMDQRLRDLEVAACDIAEWRLSHASE
jgi:hypothetical protein